MTSDQLAAMAREAGMWREIVGDVDCWVGEEKNLCRFASLALEEAAKVVERAAQAAWNDGESSYRFDECTTAIRALKPDGSATKEG